MKKIHPIFPVFLYLLLFYLATPVQARIISTSEPFLRDYERLISCGEIKNVFRSQRLWSTQAIVKNLKQIDPQNPKGWCSQKNLETLLDRMHTRLGQDAISPQKKFNFKPIRGLSAGAHYLSGGHSIYPFNGRGAINANIGTFRENRSGRHLGVGHQFYLSTDHELTYNKTNLFLRPRFDVLFTKTLSGVDAYDVMPEQGYLFTEIGPLDLVVGRAPIVWGLGEHGGALFTENARPLDHLQVTTDPFQLPWFFEKLGHWKFSFVFGTLGPETNFPWNLFSGMMLAIKPWHGLELNVGHIIQFGGQGSPALGLLDGTREFFGFIPGISQSTVGGTNKITTANINLHFYEIMAGELYLEYSMDDANFSSSWKAFEKQMKHNSNYNAGLLFNCFLGSCKDSLRLDYFATGPITYRHGQFTDGWTQNSFILGDPLGPDGKRFWLVYERDWNAGWRTRFDLRALHRQSHQYGISADGITVTIPVPGPREKRLNVAVSQDFPWKNWRFKTTAGYEFINNLGFNVGNNKSVFALEGQVGRDF